MVLSRFWYVILVILATVSFAAALLATNLVNDEWERGVRNDLVRDRYEIDLMLRLDARARLDAITGVASNSDVRSALRRASGRRAGQEIDEEIIDGLSAKLRQLNTQLDELAGDLLFAVDKNGWIVAAITPGNMPENAGLGQFPLVQRALHGYIRDDVWIYNDNVYRMAARPVVDGGQFVGAIVHGMRLDQELASRLASRLGGASLAFFRGETTIAGEMSEGAPMREEIASPLAEIIAQAEFQAGQATEPHEIEGGGLAVYSIVTGTARHNNVGYGVARPVRRMTSPTALLQEHADADDWANLPWLVLVPVALFAFLLAMFSFWLEHDRPLSRLKKAAAQLTSAPENRITITDFGGRYRAAATSINEALDNQAGAAGALGPKRQAANLDALLGPTAEEQPGGSGSFYGFAGQDQGPLDLPDVPAATMPDPNPGAPMHAGPAGMAPPPPSSSSSASPPRPPSPPNPPAPPPTRRITPAAKNRPVAPPLRGSLTTPDQDEVEETRVAPSPEEERALLKSTLIGRAPPSADDDDEDDATMVARVPRGLLESSAGGKNAEETHFRDVFDKFVATKKQCGENTAGLTFDKFAVTLRKNRDQIVKRHGASRVRFTVYEKNGKAALKATPIKG